MAKCKDCKGTGKVTLLNWSVDCECKKQSASSDVPQNFPKDSNLRNGWFSPSEAKECGSVVYEHAETGQEIEITEISCESQPFTPKPGIKFVGIVNKRKHIRGAKYGKEEYKRMKKIGVV